MITNIRIADYKSFHPTSPIDITLNALQKPVLIYGLNGAGKSSIGEVIHRSLAGDSAAAACSIQFTGQGPYRTLVYNHEFVDRVIGNVIGMPGIFTLGEPDTEKQVEIEAKDAEYVSLIKQAEELKAFIATTDDSIKRLSETALGEVWKAHTAHARGDLGHLLAGYGNSKQKFFDDLHNIIVSEGDVLPTKEELKQRWSDVSSDESKKSLVSLDMSQFGVLEVDSIWTEAIEVSGESRLAALVEAWGNSDWVSEGRAFGGGDECPFCQQVLPPDFQVELAKLLDGDRQQKIDRLQQLHNAYDQAIQNIIGEFERQSEAESFVRNDEPLRAAWQGFVAGFKANALAMRAKIAQPAKSVEIPHLDTTAVQQAITSINERITAFNIRISDKTAEKERIRNAFWKILRRDRTAAFEAYHAALTPLVAKRTTDISEEREIQNRLTVLSVRLTELRRLQTGVDAAVVAINHRLATLGVMSFSIKRKEGEGSLYGLHRPSKVGGELKSLSEGEKTLISFLYFMELLKGAEQEGPVCPIDRTIVVIDDPISSLSVNFVFDVASLIHHELMDPPVSSKARQVIVLTHNLFFLHELLRLLKVQELSRADKRCQLLRVVKHDFSSVVEMKAIDMMNDYDALWWVLREAQERQLPSHIVPNTMRCILEHFFSFNNREDWKESLAKLEQQDQTFRPLARFLDRGSHKDGINLAVMDYGQHDIGYYLAKFRAVFDATGFLSHYNARMGIVDQQNDPVEQAAAPV